MDIDFLPLITLAAGIAIGIHARWADWRPWPADYLRTRIEEYNKLPRGAWGMVKTGQRLICVDSQLPAGARRHVMRHELAHQALADLNSNCEKELEEAVADLVAYGIALRAGEHVSEYHSFSESSCPGEVLLSLDDAFECLRLAQHIHDNTRYV